MELDPYENAIHRGFKFVNQDGTSRFVEPEEDEELEFEILHK